MRPKSTVPLIFILAMISTTIYSCKNGLLQIDPIQGPDWAYVYKIPLSQSDSLTEELNILKTGENSYFAVIKKSYPNKKNSTIAIEYYDLQGGLIDDGYPLENDSYIKVGKPQRPVGFSLTYPSPDPD